MALKKLVGQTAIYGLSSIIGRLLNYLLVPIYVRLFLPEEYGVVGELFAYIAITMTLLTHGMEVAYFRYVGSNPKSAFVTGFGSHIIACACLLFFYYSFEPWVIEMMGYEDHPEYVRYLVWILVVDTLSTLLYALLRHEGKAAYFAFVRLSNIGLNIGLNLIFLVWCPLAIKNDWWGHDIALKWYDPEVGIGYIFIFTLLAGVLALLLLSPILFRVKWSFNISLWKNMLRYALPLMVGGLAYVLNETLDRILLRHWRPEEVALYELGIYNACYKLSIIMTLFIQAIRLGIEPFFFSNANKENAQESYAIIMKYVILIGLFIFLAVCFYLDQLKYFLDPAYFEGLGVVPILLMANLMLGIYFNLSVWYKLKDKTHFGALISIAGALITIVLNYLLIPDYGYMGAAWTTLAAYSFMVILSYFIGKTRYVFGYDLKTIGKSFALSLILFTVSKYFALDWLMNTLLLFIFAVWLFFTEKNTLLKWIKR